MWTLTGLESENNLTKISLPVNPIREQSLAQTRRQFFGRSATGIGTAALASLLDRDLTAAPATNNGPGVSGFPNFPGKAKRVIYLMQGGAPTHVDLMDWKPGLYDKYGTQLPDSVRMGQRLTTMTANQKQLPMLPAIRRFEQFGECGRCAGLDEQIIDASRESASGIGRGSAPRLAGGGDAPSCCICNQ